MGPFHLNPIKEPKAKFAFQPNGLLKSRFKPSSMFLIKSSLRFNHLTFKSYKIVIELLENFHLSH